MKPFFVTVVCLAVFSLSSCLSRPQTNNQQAITSVLNQKETAGVDCARILIDSRKIVSVHLHGSQYLATLKKIDVSGCPRSFRAAWADYCVAWEKKLKAETAGEETLDLISMWKGEIGDLQEACRRLEAYDTEPAWQRCEQAAAESGVQTTAMMPAR